MEKQAGFTIIELLVVVVIIGILSGLSLSQFAAYKTRTYDSNAQSDLRNAMSAQEAYFIDFEEFTTDSSLLPGFNVSDGVTITIQSASGDRWQASTYHSKGNKTFCYDTLDGGGIVNVTGRATACP